jgi:hypothetical protein
MDLCLKQNKMFQMWLMMLVSWNVPFGPDRDDYRYLQIRDTLKSYFARNDHRSAVLFQEYCPTILAEHEAAGISHPDGDLPADQALWNFLSARQHFAKVGRRVDLNRFCGSLEAAETNMPTWTTDLFERTLVALEHDFLKGRAFLNRIKVKAGPAETVTEEGGSTSVRRVLMEVASLKDAFSL